LARKTIAVPGSALALALAAAFIHASWNVLIARAGDPEAATAVAGLVGVLAFAPVALLTWRIECVAWPFVLATAILHLAYFAFLAAAYRRAELSVVYPLARGLAPVLVLVVGVTALGVGTSALQAAGVCVVGAGVLLVRGLRRAADATAVAFGVAIAVCIAAYTLVDKEGVRHANPVTYLELATALAATTYAAGVLAAKGARPLQRELSPATIVAGLAMFGAYALVLAALQLAPAAPVAAVRETSIVIATAGAALVLKERFGPVRVVGATLVVAGVILLGI
jgi:drug/metabolite transporter (DMT)-like permease